MADIAPQHLLLGQLLTFMLLGFVVVVLVNDSATTVKTELRRRHRRPFQVAAQIFHATPGPAGLFGEVHLPVPLVLRLQVALPLLLIADVPMARQGCRVNALIAGTQQTNDGTAPDGFNLLFFEKQIAPDAVFDVEAATGNGDVDVRMLIELASVGVQGAENTDFNTQLARVPEHGAGRTAKQRVEQRPVVVKEWPEQVGHGEGDVLPVAVGQDVLLCCNQLPGGFEAATAASFGLAGLAEEARMSAVSGATAVVAYAHGAGTAGEHALDGKFGPVAELVTIFSRKRSQPSSCWNNSFAGRGICMMHSIKCVDEGGKDFGCAADELTPQACYRSGCDC